MTTYCVVPSDLAATVLEPLRSHLATTPNTEVIVEQRSGERRSSAERRRADVPEAIPASGDRRAIRSSHGRRVADRRMPVATIEPPQGLPRRVRRHAERLCFVERPEPSAEHLEDADTARVVISFQAGDGDAFSLLYRRYFDRIYGYLRTALRDSQEAEDIAQEVFIRVLRTLERYETRPGKPFRAWLFRIARNAAIDVAERRRRVTVEDPARIDAAREAAAEAEGAPGLASALAVASDYDLNVLVGRLPDAQRQVVTLRYMLDLSTAEIASVLGKSPEAVYKLHERALAALQERLAALGHHSASRGRRRPMWVRLRPGPVMVPRRFALTGSAPPPGTARHPR